MKTEDDSDDAELLHIKVRKQEAEIARLGEQKVQLQSKLSSLEVKVCQIISANHGGRRLISVSQIASQSEEVIRAHPAFVALVELVGSLKKRVEEAQEEKTKAEASAAQNATQFELAKSQEIVCAFYPLRVRRC